MAKEATITEATTTKALNVEKGKIVDEAIPTLPAPHGLPFFPVQHLIKLTYFAN